MSYESLGDCRKRIYRIARPRIARQIYLKPLLGFKHNDGRQARLLTVIAGQPNEGISRFT
ncbi:MAG: hypothetical protein BECKG1743D_GA0114223_102582 [Candidatus Kentron sp. G]|nr:MAG: hypothetical protein BECKG1743F_GA0114225_102502 [Candidatus Kentron sp. G]VFN00020.1 MAG: hypothetical protein BECKG1743E_GA0114224_102982 [Candidatus Kentron sp. G]VFN01172.1 MAG: hypothetical protein BECKG1743D_GA0114223_102582 [Candidatus Kentron sp. G]